MSNRTQSIKEVLEKAKAEGCVRFVESKGYRGPGLSVYERMQEWLAANGAKDSDGNPAKLTKTALKELLLTDEFKSMRFTGKVAGEKAARKTRVGFSLLGFISGDSVAENSPETVSTASAPESSSATAAPIQEPVTANVDEDEDDIFK